MAQDAPTQLYHTKKFRQWIATVQMPAVDRFEVDKNIDVWNLYDKHILEVEAELVKRSETNHKDMFRLNAIPGISAMGAITLLSRIGDIKRFKTPDSLANYFGLTPGCHNTAGKHRVGGITKRGNAIARQVLNFAVIHVLRKDPEMKAWHKKIKNRKGSKTARVAVMRKLATIIWHILRWGKPYQFRYDPPKITRKKTPKKVFLGIDNSNRQGRKGKTPLKSRSKTRT
jgi:transposase